ncbi:MULTISPECIES: hypothetical protein [unclassified Actinomadura]|uniref:hypothetical protein n=1 Tax=unclassified Actinomadura TaxID=2626254 RepID=UPI0011EE84E9|nr:hypothetical protein [Actinomadura sp. K4S16]
MASEESGQSAGQDPIESLVDDLIREILNEGGQTTKARARGGDSKAKLIETAMTSASTAGPTGLTLERLLLVEVLASSLADALAPALAEALAPEILKAMEHPGTSRGTSRRTPASAGQAKGQKKT